MGHEHTFALLAHNSPLPVCDDGGLRYVCSYLITPTKDRSYIIADHYGAIKWLCKNKERNKMKIIPKREKKIHSRNRNLRESQT